MKRIIILIGFIVGISLYALNLENITVNMEFKDADIQSVLQVFAKEKGLNIIAGDEVRGKVTATLYNVSLKKALDTILDSNGFSYYVDGNIIRVYKKGSEKTESAIINLKYLDPEDVRNTLTPFLSERGKLSIDKATNSIIVADTLDNLNKIKGIVNKLEKRAKKVNGKNKVMANGIAFRIFTLKKARVKDVVKMIEPLLSEKGKIVRDEKSNTIMVRDKSENLKAVEQAISHLDNKPKQVMIEARILEVGLTENSSVGLDWFWRNIATGVYDSEGNPENLASFGVKIPETITDGATGGIFRYGTLDAKHFRGALRALQEKANTKLLSAPKVAALNNTSAEIEINDKWPKKEEQQMDTAGGGAKDVTTYEFVDIPIKLTVVPVIGDDGYIDLTVNLQVDNVVEIVDEATNTPRISQRKASTTLRIKNGNTIAIGGLIKNDIIKTTNKVPVLGDIPLIKHAFRSRKKNIIKNELIIFITPVIMDEKPDKTTQRFLKKYERE